MDKNTILNKVRNEENQEYENFVGNKILAKGAIPLLLLTAVIFITRVIHAEIFDLKRATSSDSLILLLGYLCYTQFLLYLNNKKKEHLLYSIIMLIFFIGFCVNFFIVLFG